MEIRELTQITEMAIRDLRHEYLMSLWTILGIAAVVTPLLVMFGLKFGMITSMKSRLIETAINREVRPTDFRSYSDAWFSTLRARPEVEFVIPDTRLLAASIRLNNPENLDASALDVTMRPTLEGDPFLEEWSVAVDTDFAIVLTTRVANSLKVNRGDTIDGVILRRQGEESAEVKLTVSGVLPRDAIDRKWVYVSLPLLVAIERYRENEGVAGLNLAGLLADPFENHWSFGSFRVFARSIDEVGALVEWLEEQGIPTHSNYDKIARIQQLDDALTLVFVILVVVAVVGGATSMGANLFAAVLRKQHELSLLRLVGYSSKAIIMFPVIQSIILSVSGGLIAVSAYALLEPVVNKQLGSQTEGLFVSRLKDGEPISRLLPEHYIMVLLAILCIGVVTASVGAIRAASISPADGLRRE